MRIAVLLAPLVAALVTGIALAADPPMDAPLPDVPVEPGLPNPPVTRVPSEIEADVRALVEEARACTDAVGCQIVNLDTLVGSNSCVAALQCETAVSADLDTAAFVAEVTPLVTEKKASGECAQASCRPPSELRAACVVGRCEIVAP